MRKMLFEHLGSQYGNKKLTSAEGGGNMLHTVTKPPPWRGGAHLKVDEQHDRSHHKRKVQRMERRIGQVGEKAQRVKQSSEASSNARRADLFHTPL